MKKNITKIIALFGISLFILTACGGDDSSKSPEQVLQSWKATIKDTQSVDMGVDMRMKGKDSGDNIDFNLNAKAKLDRRKDAEAKMDVALNLAGDLNASAQQWSGNLKAQIRTIGENFYFKVDEIDATDPNVEQIKTLLEPYKGKWQHLASDFVPESIRGLQEKDAEALQLESDLKDLFVNTKIFNVTKEYGIEKLNGNNVYHYGVKVSKEGAAEYVRKASSLTGEELTDAEVKDAVTFADSITGMELWIGTKDYYLYKGVLTLSGDSTIEGEADSEIILTYSANSYNQNLNVETPSDFDEFNPLTLFMQMQGGVDSAMLEEDEVNLDIENMEGLDELEDGAMMDEE